MKPIREVVYYVLKKTGKPMAVSELTEQVKKIRPIAGKTPNRTISAICQRHDLIERIGRGTYKYIK